MYLFIPVLTGLLGCQAELAPVTAVSPTPPIDETGPIREIEPIYTPAATAVPPTPASPPTITPPPTSTAMPRPLAILAVPPQWADAAGKAVAQLQDSPHWQWRLRTTEDGEAAHITLVAGKDGLIVRQQPLVLAVPFTTSWENTTLSRAQEILANGHPAVSVMSWDALTPEWKALRVDGRHPTDADYPFQNSWSLISEPGFEAAVAELAPILRGRLTEPVVQVAAVGDLMLARGLGYIVEQGNLDYPFVYVADYLQSADLTIGNLESALGDIGQPEDKHYPFQAPPAAAQALAQAGFDVITLANNHAMDYGPEALLQAIHLLRQQNIATIGAGASADESRRPHFAEVNGLKLAFLGYVNVPIEASTGFDAQSWAATQDSPGLAWAEPETVRADVTAVRPQADLVIVVLHSGLEYVEEPSEPQVAAARAAIDAGADLVIGHHTHILQGVHFYNGGVIVYGLGNFAFQIEGDPETAVLNVWLDKDGARQLEFIPAIIQTSGQPRPADPGEAVAILEKVYFLTRLLNAN